MWKFIKRWADVLILLPATFALLVFNEAWINYLDPTASSMSVENLSVFNFNIFIAAGIFAISYFVYNLYFHDYFGKDWEKEKLPNNPVAAAVIHLVLWLSTLGTVLFLLLRNI